jgi:hypothetical protein
MPNKPNSCVQWSVRCVQWSRKDQLPLLRYCVLATWKFFFHVVPIMSRLKPISLCNFISPNVNPDSNDPPCPPVTGWRGNPGPVRNNFDHSGFFRGRTDSAAKRKRTETQQEIDAAYDLSRDYLANNPPPKPTLDSATIKEVLATALASNVKPILDKPETSEDMRNVVRMMMVMLSVLEAVVEKGIEPLSAAAASAAKSGRHYANNDNRNGTKTAAPPVAAKPPQPGRKELVDALAKYDLESVIFANRFKTAQS